MKSPENGSVQLDEKQYFVMMGSRAPYIAFVGRNALLILANWWLRLWKTDKHVCCCGDCIAYNGAGGTWNQTLLRGVGHIDKDSYICTPLSANHEEY